MKKTPQGSTARALYATLFVLSAVIGSFANAETVYYSNGATTYYPQTTAATSNSGNYYCNKCQKWHSRSNTQAATSTNSQAYSAQNSGTSTAGNSPQAVAQRRANYLASIGTHQHVGGGTHQTSIGMLTEGTGRGWGKMPSTCSGYGPAYGDAWARAKDGSIIRVRLYKGRTYQGGPPALRGRRR